jgi:hypothetical protein
MTEHWTRRAPHMEKYVEVTRFDEDCPWQVRLKVAHQSFTIGRHGGDGFDVKEEAEWMRDMLCIALDAMVRDQRP